MFDNELKTLYDSKEELGLTWKDIAETLNKKYGTAYSADACRKRCSRHCDNYEQLEFKFEPEPQEKENDFNIQEEFDIRKEIQRLRDERSQLNSLYRQATREDFLKDIAVECAEKIAKEYPFKDVFKVTERKVSDKDGVLLLSDWHYGIEIDNHWNKYSPEICKQRIATLYGEVVGFIHNYDIQTLYVVNLGDLISGRIHSQLRIENREDAVSQTMHVAELLASFLYELSKEVEIEYYDCLDNHSRIEPNKKESLRLESLARIITWYLKERFYSFENVRINFNTYADDILTFTTGWGWNVVGVHGDLDSQRSVIKNMRGMLDIRPDLVCTAHMHHFSANEENECILISNPSVMGTDSFAESKRLSSSPAQTLVIMDANSPAYAIHRIALDEKIYSKIVE